MIGPDAREKIILTSKTEGKQLFHPTVAVVPDWIIAVGVVVVPANTTDHVPLPLPWPSPDKAPGIITVHSHCGLVWAAAQKSARPQHVSSPPPQIGAGGWST